MPQNKGYKDPTSTETIHGKKVTVGKTIGERVAKTARGAAKTRAQRIREELAGVFSNG